MFALDNVGVMRRLTDDLEVMDVGGLRPELIKAFLGRVPYIAQNETDYRGVDGTKVSREQCSYPSKDVLL